MENILFKTFGLSEKLTENLDAMACVMNYSNPNWSFRILVPTERRDIVYFAIYKNAYYPDNVEIPLSYEFCTRINMEKAEYIECDDSNISKWILNSEEKSLLCKLLNKDNQWLWNVLQLQFVDQLKGYNGIIIPELNLPIPDYSKLPE